MAEGVQRSHAEPLQLRLRFELMVSRGMKNLAAVTFAIAIAVSTPALSRTNTDDKTDCENASGIWDWINTKCLASIDFTRPHTCNKASGKCAVKTAGHQNPIASE